MSYSSFSDFLNFSREAKDMLRTSSLLKGETGDNSFHADDLHMGTGQQEKTESRECYSNFKHMRVEVICCFLSMAGAPRKLQQHFESLTDFLATLIFKVKSLSHR